jgi:hypothetical protein
MKAERELPEMLMQTHLEAHQAAHLTGLPLALVLGCQDVLNGAYLDADALRALDAAEREDYYRGQRMADAWFYGQATAEQPTECEV